MYDTQSSSMFPTNTQYIQNVNVETMVDVEINRVIRSSVSHKQIAVVTRLYVHCAVQWRRQDLMRGDTNQGAETETPKDVDWVKNVRGVPPPGSLGD